MDDTNAAPTQKNREKPGTQWLDWFVPGLLIAIAIGTLIFYPAPRKTEPPQDNLKTTTSNPVQLDRPTKLEVTQTANNLVNTFYNGSQQQSKILSQALAQTLQQLNQSKEDIPHQALTALTNQNLSHSVDLLKAYANQLLNLNKAAQVWVDIANIQNLTSANQALLAYQKATELDPENLYAWHRQADILKQLYRQEEAKVIDKKIRALANKDVSHKGILLNQQGLQKLAQGQTKSAQALFAEALNIFTTIEDENGIASTNLNLAKLYQKKGMHAKAISSYQYAITIYQQQDDFKKEAESLIALGDFYVSIDDLEKAQATYEKALQVGQNNSMSELLSKLFDKLGKLSQEQGDYLKAEEYFSRSLSANSLPDKDIKQAIATADQYANQAILNRTKGKFKIAENYHQKALEIYAKNRHTSGVISQLTNMGFLYKVWRKPEQACASWKRSLALLKKNNSSRLERIQQLIRDNNCHYK